MRMGAKSGCFRVGGTPVVTLAMVNSSKTGTIAIQDSAGGDYSAIIGSCHTSGKTGMKYPCTQLSSFAGVVAGHGVTISGYYDYYAMYHDENFYVLDQAVTDSGAAGTVPAALTTYTADQITFGSTIPTKDLFQKITVAGTMKVYEMAPAQLKFSGTFSSCQTIPYTFGFGVIPSASTATPGPTCTMGGTPMPVGAAQDAAEILVSTTFYKSFTKTTDCMCVRNAPDLLAIGTTLSTFSGILSIDTSTTTPIPEILPTTNADFGL
jgi:hypothetical protein